MLTNSTDRSLFALLADDLLRHAAANCVDEQNDAAAAAIKFTFLGGVSFSPWKLASPDLCGVSCLRRNSHFWVELVSPLDNKHGPGKLTLL